MLREIIAKADAAGKLVVYKSEFNPPIIKKTIGDGFLIKMNQIFKWIIELGINSDVTRSIQETLHSIGGMIGAFTSIDPRFISDGQEIFMKSKMIHRLGLIVDGIYREASQIIDLSISIKFLKGQMRRHFLLALDLSGFKRINDVFGHRIGDAILKQIVRELLSNEQLKNYAIKNGFSFIPVTAGGDEFLIHIEFNQNAAVLMTGAITGFIRLIRSILLNNKEMSKKLVFDEAAKKKAKAVGINIPKGFVYKFMVGIGFCSLEEALVCSEIHQDYIDEEALLLQAGKQEEIYPFRIRSLVSMFLDIADKRSNDDKDKARQDLLASGDSHKIAQAKLIDSRGLETLEKLREAMEKLEKNSEERRVMIRILSELIRDCDELDISEDMPAQTVKSLRDNLVSRLTFLRDGLK